MSFPSPDRSSPQSSFPSSIICFFFLGLIPCSLFVLSLSFCRSRASVGSVVVEVTVGVDVCLLLVKCGGSIGREEGQSSRMIVSVGLSGVSSSSALSSSVSGFIVPSTCTIVLRDVCFVVHL